MRVLVCGSRQFGNHGWLNHELDLIHRARPITLLIEGGANGADRLAREWARRKGIPWTTEEADWVTHGRAAGPIRNSLMLTKHQPNLVVAFPGNGRGTWDMIAKAQAAGIETLIMRTVTSPA